ncbi:MAG: PT domain-containing protein, partial [Dehalococcoidia bacterium]
GYDDDDDNVLDQTPTTASTDEPTAEPTDSPTVEITAEPPVQQTEDPTEEPSDGGEAGACSDSPERVLPAMLAALNAGDPEASFSCLSADAREVFGPDLEGWENGSYTEFSEGLGSFPVGTPVVFTELIAEAPDQRGVTAIAGDRTVEGMDEPNAVYAVLVVFEDSSWRMDPSNELLATPAEPVAGDTVAAGPLTLSFEISGLVATDEFPGDARLFFNGGQVTEVVVHPGEDVYIVSGEVTAQAGTNWAIAYVEVDGQLTVFGWGFFAE